MINFDFYEMILLRPDYNGLNGWILHNSLKSLSKQ